MALLFNSSQVPRLHRRSGKKLRARSASKRTGPSPAQRIAAQLASRTPKTVSQPTHSEDDPATHDDRGVDIDRERSDNTVCVGYENENDNPDSDSSTEPESNDGDAHRLWEERQERKKGRRRQNDRMVMNQTADGYNKHIHFRTKNHTSIKRHTSCTDTTLRFITVIIFSDIDGP